MQNTKELRERFGLTRKELSSFFHVPPRTIQSWELGDRSCPVYVFEMMEEILYLYQESGALARWKEMNKN